MLGKRHEGGQLREGILGILEASSPENPKKSHERKGANVEESRSLRLGARSKLANLARASWPSWATRFLVTSN